MKNIPDLKINICCIIIITTQVDTNKNKSSTYQTNCKKIKLLSKYNKNNIYSTLKQISLCHNINNIY